MRNRAQMLIKPAMLAAAGYTMWQAWRTGGYRFSGKNVVITGGSRGLGIVLARKLCQQGARVILLARDPAELEQAYLELRYESADVVTLVADVRDRDAATSAIDQVVARFGRIDVLINNAGIIEVGPLENMSEADFVDAMATHLYGPLYTCLAAAAHMREQRAGRIVNISSIGGKIAIPHMLPYCASKFALAGFSEGLRSELERFGISVTTVYPWLMRTGSPPNAEFKGNHRAEYTWFALCDALPLLSMSAELAADRILRACMLGKAHVFTSPQARAVALLHDVMPGVTAQLQAMAARMMPRPMPAHGAVSHTGWESQSEFAPSSLTRLSDRATLKNNETRVGQIDEW